MANPVKWSGKEKDFQSMDLALFQFWNYICYTDTLWKFKHFLERTRDLNFHVVDLIPSFLIGKWKPNEQWSLKSPQVSYLIIFLSFQNFL